MRRVALFLFCAVIGWAHVGLTSALAQGPPILAGGAALVPPELVPLTAAPAPIIAPCLWDERPGRAWGMDLVLGLPSGIRLFHELGSPDRWAPEVEAFAGFYLIFPALGVGLRGPFTPLRGERDALCVRPGIDLYVWQNPFHDSGGFFSGGPAALAVPAGDIDIIWQHCFDRRWAGEVGLKVGAGAVLRNHEAVVVPIAAVFLGFRY